MRPRWICCWPNPPMPARPALPRRTGARRRRRYHALAGQPYGAGDGRTGTGLCPDHQPRCRDRRRRAMAWRAGCQVADMEFVQFHPTALQVDGRAAGLVTEALRGEGAVLRLPGGERFMPAHDPRAELAPRDIVARDLGRDVASRSALRAPGHLAPAARLAGPALSAVTALCAAHGIDIATQPMPVAPCATMPAAASARTWTAPPASPACAPWAKSRARPAWRQPAGQQFAAGMRGDGTGGGKRHRRIGRCSKRGSLGGVIAGAGATACSPSHAACPEMPGAPDTIRAALRRLMQQQAGIIRSDEGLADAAGRIAAWRRELPPDADPGRDARWLALRNQLDVCGLIVDAAARRRKSRGAHASSDWPAPATRRAASSSSRRCGGIREVGTRLPVARPRSLPSWSRPTQMRTPSGRQAHALYRLARLRQHLPGRAMTGASTMRPSSMNAPGPPSRCAASTRRAQSSSAAAGAKA